MRLYSNERVIIKGPQESYGGHNISYCDPPIPNVPVEPVEPEGPIEWLMWDYDPFEPLLKYDTLVTKVFT